MPTDNGSVSINLKGIEASEIFLTPVYTDPAITNVFRIMDNVNYKKRIAFMGDIPNPIRKYMGCKFDPTEGATLSDRDIDTFLVQVNIKMCDEEFYQTDYDQLLNYDDDRYNFEGTIFLTALRQRIQTAMVRQLNMLAFFGDMSSNNPEQNLCDGLFTKFLPEGVNRNEIPYVKIADQNEPLTNGEGIQLMNEVYYNRSKALKGIDKSRQCFLVSSAVYDRIEQDFDNAMNGSNFYRQNIEEGESVLMYKGIKVIEMKNWDTNYNHYIDPTVDDAKLIILTTPDNMIMATDKRSDLGKLSVKVEEFEQITKVKSFFKIGFNYVFETFFSVAY